MSLADEIQQEKQDRIAQREAEQAARWARADRMWDAFEADKAARAGPPSCARCGDLRLVSIRVSANRHRLVPCPGCAGGRESMNFTEEWQTPDDLLT